MKKSGLLWLALYFLIIAAPLWAQYPLAAQNHFQVGQGRLKEGRLEEAEKELQEAIKIAPDYKDAYYLLGICQFQQQAYSIAQETFQELLKHDSRFTPAYLYLAEIYRINRKYDKAALQLEKALQIDPGLLQAQYALGVLYYAQGKLELAISQWEKILPQKKDDPNVLYNLGCAYFQKKDFKAAYNMLVQAVKFSPNEADCHFALAWVLDGMGKQAEAKATYENLLKQFPNTPYSNLTQAILQINAGEPDHAQNFLTPLEEKKWDNYYLPLLEARIAQMRNQPDNARKYLEQALQLNPNSWQARKMLEQLKLQKEAQPGR